jgi:hypothetical protein
VNTFYVGKRIHVMLGKRPHAMLGKTNSVLYVRLYTIMLEFFL